MLFYLANPCDCESFLSLRKSHQLPGKNLALKEGLLLFCVRSKSFVPLVRVGICGQDRVYWGRVEYREIIHLHRPVSKKAHKI